MMRCPTLLRAIGFVLLWQVSLAASATDDPIDELVALMLLREDVANQYAECVEGSKKIARDEIEHSLDNEWRELTLDAEDVALLVSIYTEYYLGGCDYLDGEEIVNFYRSEIRQRFSEADIEALIEFYRSPIGDKLSREWLAINQAFGQLLIERQLVENYAAQRLFEQRMEDFWTYLERKATGQDSQTGA